MGDDRANSLALSDWAHLQNQHGVAVAVKAVAGFDCGAVGVQCLLPAGEGHDEGKQRAAGQVEVCHEGVHGAAAVRWIDEDIRPSDTGGDLAGGGSRFEDTHARGSDGDDAAAGLPGVCHGFHGSVGDFIPLMMHAMIAQVVHFDGLKSAEADMQNDFGDGRASRANPIEKLRREMQTGGGGGDRAGHSGVDCLVLLAIDLIVLFVGKIAMDVRRQGHGADTIENLSSIVGRLDRYLAHSAIQMTAPDDRPRSAVERKVFAFAKAPRAGEQDAPSAGGVFHKEQARDSTAGGAPGDKPCRKDTGAVEHEAIGRGEVLREICKDSVLNLSGISVKDEETCGIAPVERLLGDESRWQVVLKL